jgi:acyl-CoA thioesterase-1
VNTVVWQEVSEQGIDDMRKTLLLATLTTILILGAGATAQDQKPKRPGPLAPIEDQAGLPRVLLIGDSISIGYTLPVRTLLKGKANVHRPNANCGPTTRGLESIDKWLGDGKWDVIHFNWGLHDLKYLGPNGENLADPKAKESRQQVPPDEYRGNLEQLVVRLKKTGASLIWCNTTPVPKGAKGRLVGDAKKYNQIAVEVMKKHEVQVNDLYGQIFKQLATAQRPANVHFTPDGSAILAKQVARAIEAQLKNR